MISRPSANGKQNPSGTVPPAAAQLHPAVGGEGHPLCLQHRPLDAGAKCWGGGAVGTHHPVAGHGWVLTGRHGISHQPGAPWHPGQPRHLAVGGHTSGGDPPDHVIECAEDCAAHFSRTSYRSVRRAEKMGSWARTASSRSTSRSAYRVVSSAPARQSTAPQGSTAMELP